MKLNVETEKLPDFEKRVEIVESLDGGFDLFGSQGEAATEQR